MDIRFYNWERELLCVVPQFESVNFYLYYNEIGTGEIHLNVSCPQAKTILKNDFLVAVVGDIQALVVIKEVVKSELCIYLRTLNWLLTKRVCLPFSEKSRNTAREIKNCVPEYMTIGQMPTIEEKEETIERTSAQTAFDAIKAMLDTVKMGHEVRMEKTQTGVQWIFNVLPRRKTEILLSEDVKNVCEASFSIDALEYASSGYYLKNDEWTKIAKDNKSGIYEFETILESENKADAKEELRKKVLKRTSQGKMRNLEFGKDYNLGDEVTMKYKRGDFALTTVYRISGIHIAYEAAGKSEEPVFEEVENEL